MLIVEHRNYGTLCLFLYVLYALYGSKKYLLCLFLYVLYGSKKNPPQAGKKLLKCFNLCFQAQQKIYIVIPVEQAGFFIFADVKKLQLTST
jgi:hypothetical protein